MRRGKHRPRMEKKTNSCRALVGKPEETTWRTYACMENNIRININLLKTNSRFLCLKIQFVPRSKHFISVIKTSQFKLYGTEVAVCSQINRKHKYSVDRKYNCWMLNLLVHHITSKLWKVKTDGMWRRVLGSFVGTGERAFVNKVINKHSGPTKRGEFLGQLQKYSCCPSFPPPPSTTLISSGGTAAEAWS
jgi:hypothetical protein